VSFPPGEFFTVTVCNVTDTDTSKWSLFLKLDETAVQQYVDVVTQCKNVARQSFTPRREYDETSKCLSFPVCHTSSFYFGRARTSPSESELRLAIVWIVVIVVSGVAMLAMCLWYTRAMWQKRQNRIAAPAKRESSVIDTTYRGAAPKIECGVYSKEGVAAHTSLALG
jgi:hypothetical protein